MRSRQRLIDLLATANLDLVCPRPEYRAVAADILRGAIRALNGDPTMHVEMFSATLAQNLKGLHLFATPHIRELLHETIKHLDLPVIDVTPEVIEGIRSGWAAELDKIVPAEHRLYCARVVGICDMALASLDGAERVKQLEAELAQLKLKLIGDCV